MPQRICLFMINGLGLGNSTRCYAVMQRLHQRGISIHVITSDNGITFLNDKPEVAGLTRMESLFYTTHHNRLCTIRTVFSLGELRWRAARKRAQLEAFLETVRPTVCVTDSEYTVSPLRRRGIPVVALNNSDVVVSEYFSRKTPRSIAAQFWCVEFLDYLFHRTRVDAVISPAAKPLPPRHSRIKRVGLIVRREVQELIPRATPPHKRRPPREMKNVTFMLSGSILGRIGQLPFNKLPYNVSVVGQDGKSNGQVTYHGKVMNNIRLLADSDLLVINGGFSAVSEALALGKPTVVMPVPGHAEQYVNACQVEDLGMGWLASEDEVIPLLVRLHEADEWIGLSERVVDTNGAATAAEHILDIMERREQTT